MNNDMANECLLRALDDINFAVGDINDAIRNIDSKRAQVLKPLIKTLNQIAADINAQIISPTF